MKLLLLDIETAPMVAFIWSLNYGNDRIPIDRIVSPGYTLCWAAKWHGKREVMFEATWKGGMMKMLDTMHGLIDEADAVCHYNGTSFDMPTLNKEFIKHNIKPPSPYKQIDLLPTARKKFRFESNKLDFVAQFLGLGKKLPHKGMGLWDGVMKGNEADQRVMERYNKQDVRLLEKVYDRLLPWIPNHPNLALYTSSTKPACTHCGSKKVQSRGEATTTACVYKRYQCQSCGNWMRGTKAEKRTHALVDAR